MTWFCLKKCIGNKDPEFICLKKGAYDINFYHKISMAYNKIDHVITVNINGSTVHDPSSSDVLSLVSIYKNIMAYYPYLFS